MNIRRSEGNKLELIDRKERTRKWKRDRSKGRNM
jgi:hypothetical protein